MSHARRPAIALVTALTLSLLIGCASQLSHAAPRADAGLQAAGTGGMVMLVGGGLKDDNRDLWEAMHRHAAEASGKSRPRVAVFGTARPSLAKARESYELDGPGSLSYKSVFERYGFAPAFVPIAIDNHRTAAHDPALVRLVEESDAVWFGGGNQSFHARSLLEDDGSDTPLMRAVRRVHARGGLIAGTSAGAAIMDASTYGDGTSPQYLKANRLVGRSVAHFDDPNAPWGDGETGGYTTGFGMLSGIDAGVDTHTDARGRYGRVLVAMGALGYTHGLAVSENTGLLVRGKRGVVYGADRVFVACGRRATYTPGAPFQAKGLVLHSLAPHDAIHFDRHAVESRREPVAAGGPAPAPLSDVLDRRALITVMERFAIAGAAASAQPAGPFTFQLRKNGETRAFSSPADGHTTVAGIELDVTVRP